MESELGLKDARHRNPTKTQLNVSCRARYVSNDDLFYGRRASISRIDGLSLEHLHSRKLGE